MTETNEIKIFIIEDDFVFIEILVNLLDSVRAEMIEKNINVSYQTFYSTKEASFELSQNPDIVMLDYFLMDDELNADTGTKLLNMIKEFNPKTDVIIVSGQESESVRNELVKKGATNYLSKDEESIKRIKPLIISLIDKKLSNL